MCAADDAPDGVAYDAAEQLCHDLLTPVTAISAHAQWLARDIRRSPSLHEEERTRMLTGVMAIEAAVQSLCAVIHAMRDEDRRTLLFARSWEVTVSTPIEELAAKMPQLSPQELEQFAAMVERMRQLRRHAGIPDGMSVQDAVEAHIISAEELERARWGTSDETS